MDNVSAEKNDVKSCPRDSGYDSLSNKLSILDKLLHTHPVWLQLGLNDAEAMEILQAQPPGVRRISVSLRPCFSRMLCCHFTPRCWTPYSNDQVKLQCVLDQTFLRLFWFLLCVICIYSGICDEAKTMSFCLLHNRYFWLGNLRSCRRKSSLCVCPVTVGPAWKNLP